MRISVEGRRLTFAVDASAVAPAQEEDHLYPKAAASKSGATVGQAGTPGARATTTPTTPHVIAHAEALPRTVSATGALGSDASPLALTDSLYCGSAAADGIPPRTIVEMQLLQKCKFSTSAGQTFYDQGPQWPPEPPPTLARLELVPLGSKKHIRFQLIQPMSNRVEGEFPRWRLPDCTGEQNRFLINWSQVDPINLGHTQVTSWKLEFYTDEADPQTYCRDKPRLDIKLTLADGS